VVNQQSNTRCLGGSLCVVLDVFRTVFFLLLLEQLLIKLNEKQSLVADIREEVILSDEIEDVWPPQPQEELERLSWLTVRSVPGGMLMRRLDVVIRMLTVQQDIPL